MQAAEHLARVAVAVVTAGFVQNGFKDADVSSAVDLFVEELLRVLAVLKHAVHGRGSCRVGEECVQLFPGAAQIVVKVMLRLKSKMEASSDGHLFLELAHLVDHFVIAAGTQGVKGGALNGGGQHAGC